MFLLKAEHPRITLSSRAEGRYCFLRMSESIDAWFQREVLSQEGVLLGYLRRMWPRSQDVEDLAQEAYARLYQAALLNRPVNARAFLFTIARHLMADRIRRERIVSIQAIGDLESLNVLVDEVSAERQVTAHQELSRLAEALDALPPKCREVVWLRRVEELSQQQVAERLGITVKTVEAHIARGMELLTQSILSEERPQGRGRATEFEQDDEQRKS